MTGKKPVRILVQIMILSGFLAWLSPTWAALPPLDPVSCRISLLTLGPGDLIYERFGHNAIVVQDKRSGLEVAFNYGVFSFDDPGFIGRFLEGKMIYWMEPDDYQKFVAYYRGQGRSILLQELNLTDAEKEELVPFLIRNARPENRNYLYNYYTANCSTKVRDVLDKAVNGQVRQQLENKSTGDTYRSLTRRIARYDFFLYTGLYFALGPATDRALSAWQESFLPMELAAHLRGVKLADGRELVRSEQYLAGGKFSGLRPVPNWAWIYFLIAVAWSGLILWGYRRACSGGRMLLLTAGATWILLSAFGGVFLVWGFTTEHWAVYWNQNILLLAPTALPLLALWCMALLDTRIWRWLAMVLVILAIVSLALSMFWPVGAALLVLALGFLLPARWVRPGVLVLVGVMLLLTLAALALKVVPGWWQENREMIALAGPLNAALAFAAFNLLKPAAAPPAVDEARGDEAGIGKQEERSWASKAGSTI